MRHNLIENDVRQTTGLLHELLNLRKPVARKLLAWRLDLVGVEFTEKLPSL